MLKALAVALTVTAVATVPALGKATDSETAARSAQTTRAILVQASPAPTSTTTVPGVVKVVLSGKVQGASYRGWAVRRAKVLKIRGLMENAPNRIVHALLGVRMPLLPRCSSNAAKDPDALACAMPL